MNNKLCVSIAMGCVLFLSGCEVMPTCSTQEVTKKIERDISDDRLTKMRFMFFNNIYASDEKEKEKLKAQGEMASKVLGLKNITLISKDKETGMLTCSATLKFYGGHRDYQPKVDYFIEATDDKEKYQISYMIDYPAEFKKLEKKGE